MWFGRFERIEDSVAGLANLIGSSHAVPRLVRVEGIDGVGKSRLSRSLKTELSGEHLEVDEGFRHYPEQFESFVETVQVESFRKAVFDLLRFGRWVVADTVCLDEILPETQFGRGFRFYVMSLDDHSDGFSRWDYQRELSREPTGFNALDLSIWDYHLKFRPHERSDAIVQILG
jgi:hypothetical protein